jgi:hypothetical protein
VPAGKRFWLVCWNRCVCTYRNFTLTSVLEEINRWWQAGHSCFIKLLNLMKLRPCAESILDRLLPVPDG